MPDLSHLNYICRSSCTLDFIVRTDPIQCCIVCEVISETLRQSMIPLEAATCRVSLGLNVISATNAEAKPERQTYDTTSEATSYPDVSPSVDFHVNVRVLQRGKRLHTSYLASGVRTYEWSSSNGVSGRAR